MIHTKCCNFFYFVSFRCFLKQKSWLCELRLERFAFVKERWYIYMKKKRSINSFFFCLFWCIVFQKIYLYATWIQLSITRDLSSIFSILLVFFSSSSSGGTFYKKEEKNKIQSTSDSVIWWFKICFCYIMNEITTISYEFWTWNTKIFCI